MNIKIIKEILNKFCFGFVDNRDKRMKIILENDNQVNRYLEEMKGNWGMAYNGIRTENKNGTITIEYKDEIKVFTPVEVLKLISQKTLL